MRKKILSYMLILVGALSSIATSAPKSYTVAGQALTQEVVLTPENPVVEKRFTLEYEPAHLSRKVKKHLTSSGSRINITQAPDALSETQRPQFTVALQQREGAPLQVTNQLPPRPDGQLLLASQMIELPCPLEQACQEELIITFTGKDLQGELKIPWRLEVSVGGYQPNRDGQTQEAQRALRLTESTR